MASEIPLVEMVRWLDDLLETGQYADWPNAFNGLQVEGTRPVRTVLGAVDACAASIREASDSFADLLVVHHGLFWSGLQPITGAFYQRVAPLIRSGCALYSSHLPLDAHPLIGNNAVLAHSLGAESTLPFGLFNGRPIGCRFGCSADPMSLIQKLSGMGASVRLAGARSTEPTDVAVVSGGGGAVIREAADCGCGILITGEVAHHEVLEAEEAGVSLILCGHYWTETLGVKALLDLMSDRFGVNVRFHAHDTGA